MSLIFVIMCHIAKEPQVRARSAIGRFSGRCSRAMYNVSTWWKRCSCSCSIILLVKHLPEKNAPALSGRIQTLTVSVDRAHLRNYGVYKNPSELFSMEKKPFFSCCSILFHLEPFWTILTKSSWTFWEASFLRVQRLSKGHLCKSQDTPAGENWVNTVLCAACGDSSSLCKQSIWLLFTEGSLKTSLLLLPGERR